MKSNKEIVAEFMSWFVVVGKKCLLNSDDEKVGEVLASDMAVRLAELLEAKDSATRAMIESLPERTGDNRCDSSCMADAYCINCLQDYVDIFWNREISQWKKDALTKLK